MVSAVRRGVEIGTRGGPVLKDRQPAEGGGEDRRVARQAADPKCSPLAGQDDTTPAKPSNPPVTTGRRSASMPVAAPRKETISGVVATMSSVLATDVWVSAYMKNTWYNVLFSAPASR